MDAGASHVLQQTSSLMVDFCERQVSPELANIFGNIILRCKNFFWCCFKGCWQLIDAPLIVFCMNFTLVGHFMEGNFLKCVAVKSDRF